MANNNGVDRDEVINAYRLILGRDPENEDVIRELQKIGSRDELRERFITSDEFVRDFQNKMAGKVGTDVIENVSKLLQNGGSFPKDLLSEDGTLDMEVLQRMFAQARECSKVKSDYVGLQEHTEWLRHMNNSLSRLHNEVVEAKWTNDSSRKKWVCWEPFTNIEIHHDGSVYPCCTAYVKFGHIFGNVYQQSFDEIWNSDNAKKMRYCVSKGDFEYCNSICKWMDERNFIDVPYGHPMIPREEFPYSYENWQDCVMEASPKKIGLSCDESCNLLCKSCRHQYRVLSRDKAEKMYQMYMRVVRPALKDCTMLNALISGEFFASQPTMDFYKSLTREEFPNLSLSLLTNGTLFTAKKWTEFGNLKGMLKHVYISVDAGTKETYERLRLGGSWDKLCSNLEFISSLKDSEGVQDIAVNLVVQRDNFREIPLLVDLAKRLRCTAVELQSLQNFGSYSQEEYSALNVLDPNNPNFREAAGIINDVVKSEKGIAITGSAPGAAACLQ